MIDKKFTPKTEPESIGAKLMMSPRFGCVFRFWCLAVSLALGYRKGLKLEAKRSSTSWTIPLLDVGCSLVRQGCPTAEMTPTPHGVFEFKAKSRISFTVDPAGV